MDGLWYIRGGSFFMQASLVSSKTFIKFAEYMTIPSSGTETGRIEENIFIHIELCIELNGLSSDKKLLNFKETRKDS